MDQSAKIQRRKQFQQHIQKQEKAREQNLAQKRLKQLTQQNPQQKMLFIQKHFREKMSGTVCLNSDLEKDLAGYREKLLSYEQLMRHFNEHKEFYLQSNYAMNTFDRQNYKEQLEKMLATITDVRKKLEPRKKFRFSRRDEDFGVKVIKSEKVEEAGKESFEDRVPGLAGLQGQTVSVPREDLNKPFKVIKCKDSQIQLCGTTQILFLKDLKGCSIKAGPTKSAVFVDHCQDCTLQIACHQLRIHNTTDTTFSIFCSSKPIIEDTTRVTFKQYGFTYDKSDEDVKACGMTGKQNLWREIQDFNWLKQEASPNFTLA